MAVASGKEIPLVISYLTMRRLIGALAIFLPFLLLVIGSIVGQAVQGSISEYYYTGMRDPFEGILCAISLFLLSYKGYKIRDVLAGKLTGAALIGVILFPTSHSGFPAMPVGVFQISDKVSQHVHYGFAALTFLLLALTSIFLFRSADPDRIPITRGKKRRNRVYLGCGITIIAAILLIGVHDFFLKDFLSQFKPVLILETIALAAFGASWLVKGETLFQDDPAERNQATRRARRTRAS